MNNQFQNQAYLDVKPLAFKMHPEKPPREGMSDEMEVEIEYELSNSGLGPARDVVFTEFAIEDLAGGDFKIDFMSCDPRNRVAQTIAARAAVKSTTQCWSGGRDRLLQFHVGKKHFRLRTTAAYQSMNIPGRLFDTRQKTVKVISIRASTDDNGRPLPDSVEPGFSIQP